MATSPAGQAAAADLQAMMTQRFPLIPRPKPACPALPVRVARVRDLARLADQHTGDALMRAAEAHNLAALITSDCGMPTLARTLCWQQFDILTTLRSVDAATAKLALQPVINLARLLIREGDGAAAYQLLETIFTAVTSRTDTMLDNRTITVGGLVSGGDEHRELVRWLWTVLLADGTRALTRAGRWTEALQHVTRHNGVGRRLLDGRQVAILTRCAAHDYDTARSLLTDTDTPLPGRRRSPPA